MFYIARKFDAVVILYLITVQRNEHEVIMDYPLTYTHKRLVIRDMADRLFDGCKLRFKREKCIDRDERFPSRLSTAITEMFVIRLERTAFSRITNYRIVTPAGFN